MRSMLSMILLAVLIPLQGWAQQATSMTGGNQLDFEQYSLAGEAFGTKNAISASQMLEVYQGLQIGDSIEVTLNTSVNSVCKSKGCWMKLDLGADEESMVKFKDYAFFVP